MNYNDSNSPSEVAVYPYGAGTGKTYRPASVTSKPKTVGHDTVLKALQKKGSMTTIIFAGGDDTMTGTVVASDKYTITIRDGNERHILYKSDIRSVTGAEDQVSK